MSLTTGGSKNSTLKFTDDQNMIHFIPILQITSYSLKKTNGLSVLEIFIAEKTTSELPDAPAIEAFIESVPIYQLITTMSPAVVAAVIPSPAMGCICPAVTLA